jgi:hypothetical protein
VTRRASLRWLAVCLLATSSLLTAACRKRTSTEGVKARFGVFFGGQIQEREEIPLILDRSRLSLGLRVEWPEPPPSPSLVRWELAQPANPKDADAGELVAYGEARSHAGEATLDVPLSFRPKDRPGSWRVRVDVDEKRVLDRGFKVVPPGRTVEPEE